MSCWIFTSSLAWLEAQVNTQEYGRRPYGVGFLVIGQDQTGPHLFEFSPSGNSYEYFAMSIGARSQSAKTYLEKHFESFADCSSHRSPGAVIYLSLARYSGRADQAWPARAPGDAPTGQRTQHQQYFNWHHWSSWSRRKAYFSSR